MTREQVERGEGAIVNRHTLIWWTPDGYLTTECNGETLRHPEAEIVGYFNVDGTGPHWV